MVIACPHCHILVAPDPQAGTSPADCPRCGTPLVVSDEAKTPAPSLATLLHAAPSPTEPAHVETRVADAETTYIPPTVPAETAIAAQADLADEPAAPRDDATHEETIAATDAPSPDAAPAVAIDAAPPAPLPARKANGPRFLHRARTTPVHTRRARLQWAAVVALSLLLSIQVVIADRARLATQAGWRPVVAGLCGIVGCDVPTWREPAAFTMLSRDVRPLIERPGTLQAQATFRNEARWAQAWPVILLTLKDADGRTLGARALQPGDYLPEGEAAEAIGPGQSAQMAVRIREPSASVVAFSFDFR